MSRNPGFGLCHKQPGNYYRARESRNINAPLRLNYRIDAYRQRVRGCVRIVHDSCSVIGQPTTACALWTRYSDGRRPICPRTSSRLHSSSFGKNNRATSHEHRVEQSTASSTTRAVTIRTLGLKTCANHTFTESFRAAERVDRDSDTIVQRIHCCADAFWHGADVPASRKTFQITLAFIWIPKRDLKHRPGTILREIRGERSLQNCRLEFKTLKNYSVMPPLL